MINIYGPNKPCQWENFFKSSLTYYTTNTQNAIIGEDFNIVEELKNRLGGAICNTQLVGSEALTEIIKFQNHHDTWWKTNPVYLS